MGCIRAPCLGCQASSWALLGDMLPVGPCGGKWLCDRAVFYWAPLATAGQAAGHCPLRCKCRLAAQILVSSHEGRPQIGNEIHSFAPPLALNSASQPAGQVPQKQRTTTPSAGPAVAVHKQRAQEALAAYLNGEAEQAPWEALGMSRPPLIAGVFPAAGWAWHHCAGVSQCWRLWCT